MELAGISPRLARLLELLLNAKEPIKVDALASMFGTSRRTIFRELEHAGSIVTPVQARLVSVPGKGIVFSGSEEARKSLCLGLTEVVNQPGSKRERLLALVIAILANTGEIQKLFFYADKLKVSESTISNDLDELEKWFAGHGITLTRKSGMGVLPEGTEEAARIALVSRFLTDGDTGGKSYTAAFGYPGDSIEQGIREVLRRAGEKLEWMTTESYTMISLYLMIMVQRFCQGKILTRENPRLGDYQTGLSRTLSDEIIAVLSISITNAEKQALAAQIQACRAKQDTPLELGSLERQELIQQLTHKMIERFDPPVAIILKTNEFFVKLLSRHLGSALTRLGEGLEHPNPLETELANIYPDVFQKTCRAVTVLEEYLGLTVPTSEITFIEIHFLAALSVLGEKNIRKRFLRAGIICVAGIGMSYMLASQIRKRFIGELELDILGWDDRPSWGLCDFLISTIPLQNVEKPVILVQTMLREDDYRRIQNAINTYAFVERGAMVRTVYDTLDNRLEVMEGIFRQTRALLNGFSVEPINDDCDFEELVRFAAARFAPATQDSIYSALLAREKTASQVIPDLKIVLLHTRSAAVTVPVFAIIIPEGKLFTSSYFKGAKSCVLMLLPETAPAEMTGLMGGISSALIDVPVFLDSIRDGNERAIKALLETELSDALVQYCKEKLKK